MHVVVCGKMSAQGEHSGSDMFKIIIVLLILYIGGSGATADQAAVSDLQAAPNDDEQIVNDNSDGSDDVVYPEYVNYGKNGQVGEGQYPVYGEEPYAGGQGWEHVPSNQYKRDLHGHEDDEYEDESDIWEDDEEDMPEKEKDVLEKEKDVLKKEKDMLKKEKDVLKKEKDTDKEIQHVNDKLDDVLDDAVMQKEKDRKEDEAKEKEGHKDVQQDNHNPD